MLSALNRGAAYTTAAIIGFIGTMAFLSSGSLGALFFIFLGPTLAVLIHELGHAFAAWRLGIAVRTISVGPISLHTHPLRFALNDAPLGHDVGGYVIYDESDGRYLTRRTNVLITAAGPLANLLTAIITYSAGRFLDEGPAMKLLVGFAFTSFAAFVLSIWPHKLASGRGNDGLELLRDLTTGRPKARQRFGKPKRSPWRAQ